MAAANWRMGIADRMLRTWVVAPVSPGGEDMQYWSAYPAPSWLVALPWAPDCQVPVVRAESQYSQPVFNKRRAWPGVRRLGR